MKKIAWITDVHFDFLKPYRVKDFIKSIAEYKPDVVLVGGDIGEAHDIDIYLGNLEEILPCPIYFVLGNHDFYGGSIYGVRAKIEKLTRHSHRLHWLPSTGIVELSKETCLIGHGSWADGRLGNYEQSQVMLNDYYLIEELAGLDRNTRLLMLNKLGDETAAYFKDILKSALEKFHHVLVLAHVPPFKDACWHEGHISDDNYLPHFSCKAVGEVLIESMRLFPNKEMTVLCGHTHGAAKAQILSNLYVKTGGAAYGIPKIQEIITIK